MKPQPPELTRFGFTWGAAEVKRLCFDNVSRANVIVLKTPKTEITITVTKSGKVRVFRGTVELVEPPTP